MLEAVRDSCPVFILDLVPNHFAYKLLVIKSDERAYEGEKRVS
jgi:hypothetical protein